MTDQFYKDQFFEALNKRLDNTDTKLETLSEKLDTLNGHVLYIYAFAAGVGFVFSMLWAWLKDKLFS